MYEVSIDMSTTVDHNVEVKNTGRTLKASRIDWSRLNLNMCFCHTVHWIVY